MKRMWMVAGLIGLLAGVIPVAADENPSPQAVVDRLLQNTGIPDMLTSIPEQFKQDMAKRQIESDGDVLSRHFSRMMQATDEAYNADLLYQDVISHFVRNFSQSDIAEIRAWSRTPLGLKIARLENVSNTPDGQMDMMRFTATIASEPPPAERLELIRRLDKAIGGSEMAVQLALATFRAIFTGVVKVDAINQDNADPEVLATQLEQQMRPAMRKQIDLIFLYTYQSLSNEELARYASFYESRAGQWFSQNTQDALVGAMHDAGDRFGQSLVGLMPQAESETAAMLPQF